ncbi:DUF222 domain-containing protein [Blastococcus sp. SYSU D00669]
MDEVASALDALAGEDLHVPPAEDLLDRTRGLVELVNRAQAELSRTVRVAENRQAFARDGATARSWLKGHCRLAGPAAAQVVRNGRVAERFPAVAAAHAAGAITTDAVSTIAAIGEPRAVALAAAQGIDLAETAAILARLAAAAPHVDLERAVRAFLERLDADGPEPDPTEQRSLTFTRRADGRLFLRGELDAVGGERFQAAIAALDQAHRPAGDTRSLAQRQADAAVQLADLHLGCGTLPLLRTVKPQVAVTVDLADLLDPTTGRGAARTGFGAVLSAARARWAACDADLTRIALGPNGEPLDLGRRPRCRGPRRAGEAWGAAGSFHSPAATPRTTGARSTTCSPGRSAARPAWTTPGCSANGTTPRSTTASASSGTPPAGGTPTGPTAPRSTSSGHPPTSPSSPAPAEACHREVVTSVSGPEQAPRRRLEPCPSPACAPLTRTARRSSTASASTWPPDG